ncbi:MAG: TetR/AcrR family transcriptional regulator [Pseudomonadota bacterium]
MSQSDRQKRDLRQQLIDAALEILDEKGLAELTLRKVAARVGVSHAAPAHHFKGLPQLLGAVVAVGFADLADRMETLRDVAPADPWDRLTAVCRGYVDFARDNPGLISLMFNTNRDRVDASEFGGQGQRAYALLKEASAPFEPIGEEPDSTETLVWSFVHGFAFLTLGGRFDNRGRTTGQPDIADVMPRLRLKKAFE